ncbi:fibronectin type III domain-containing protein [Desulfogranum japonicum]|uniref:fibronectin type III domain-containing protein n=1 Tax=Desulfogranum japonicum TaxID=231447 RepID=UPI00048DC528|nr:hypothetical protein [Desulfogranum japonicum]
MIKRTCYQRSVLGLKSLFAGCCCLLLVSCGYKDKPVAPQTVVPKPVTDLRYQLSEKGVSLYWSYPIETVTGDDITDIAEFELYRAVVPVDSYCENCPIPFGPAIKLDGGALPNEGKKTASYQATLLRPGNLYFFKVRSKTGWWAESADSNIVQFLWNTPALAPGNISIEAGDKSNTLHWDAVTMRLDETPVSETIQYQVYRSVSGKTFEPVGSLTEDTSFVDTQVANGRKYFYQVQTVSLYEEGTVGGGVSDTVSATPMDKTPPATPDGLRGIKTEVGIKVFWNPVKDKDVRGYRVYRRVEGENGPQFVGEVLLPYTMFIDRQPPGDAAQLYYSVTCIDQQEPANESARSLEVMIRR